MLTTCCAAQTCWQTEIVIGREREKDICMCVKSIANPAKNSKFKTEIKFRKTLFREADGGHTQRRKYQGPAEG